MNCPFCAKLNDENIRRAFTERKPLSTERVSMDVPWHDAISPDGKPAVRAQFFCDACGTKTDIVIELVDETDPADWWKS